MERRKQFEGELVGLMDGEIVIRDGENELRFKQKDVSLCKPLVIITEDDIAMDEEMSDDEKTTQKEDKRQGMDKNENREMIEAVAALAKEKNISKELLFSAIEEALKSAYKNNFSKEYGMPPSNANVRVELNRETGAVRLYARKTVERWPTDEATEISIEEAQAIQPSYQQDDIVEVEVTPDNFRRVAAQTAKQVIVQKIREAERGKV